MLEAARKRWCSIGGRDITAMVSAEQLAWHRQVRAAVTQTRGETEGTDGWISSGVRRELARELHL